MLSNITTDTGADRASVPSNTLTARHRDTGSNGRQARQRRGGDVVDEPLYRCRFDDGLRGRVELVALARVLVPLDGQTGVERRVP